MAYFFLKSNYKKGTYLQIYESFYDTERKGGAHRSYKALGYVHELQAQGIDDPISFYQEEVKKLNQAFQAAKADKKARQISDDSPEKLIGNYPMKNINDKLSVKSQALRLEHGVEHRRKKDKRDGFHRYTSCATFFHAVPSLTGHRRSQGWHAAKVRNFT